VTVEVAVIESLVDTSSGDYLQNQADMLAALDHVRDLESRVVKLSDKQRERYSRLHKLLPRDRIDQLIDPGSAFISLSSLGGLGIDEDDAAEQVLGGCVITGIGTVCGSRVAMIVSDSAIKGGTGTWAGSLKFLRTMEIAQTDMHDTGRQAGAIIVGSGHIVGQLAQR